MNAWTETETRVLEWIRSHGGDMAQAEWLLASLRNAGVQLADAQRDEMVCRWVSVLERAVPPEADTLIRTITRTVDGLSTSSTHWLDGLRGPRLR